METGGRLVYGGRKSTAGGRGKDQTQPSMYENDIMKMLER